jgi:hypothetical protein
MVYHIICCFIRIQSIVEEKTERTVIEERNEIYLIWGLNTAEVCLFSTENNHRIVLQRR